jgi:hypothetical protein
VSAEKGLPLDQGIPAPPNTPCAFFGVRRLAAVLPTIPHPEVIAQPRIPERQLAVSSRRRL